MDAVEAQIHPDRAVIVPSYRDIADLKTQVSERLRTIAAEDIAPWCKLGRVVFRAIEVEDHGNVLTVVGRVRDDAVARALEEAGGDKWNRSENVRITYLGHIGRLRRIPLLFSAPEAENPYQSIISARGAENVYP